MIRFIIRHAQAEPGSASGSDDDRPLSEKGEWQAAYLARALGDFDTRPTRILSSPILRARQTAQAISDGLGIGLEIEAALSTHAYSSGAMEFFGALADDEPVAIVGHNPTFSILAEACTGTPVSLKTGMCAVLDMSGRPRGSLVGLIRMASDEFL